ncbi:MAG: DNA mismatch repair endonuclease MutL [Candidatus Electrothrix sp. GW3-4]|uniref:DNA mismatch repair endonuclease MutL n=1 Tax=Candidatus Electrothrix sp. GW3-4 TaxID=3126740 RepID=UPI0030D030F0
MSKIRVLSDHLANQIAAGEVVERPASVAKELLENALDAGADRVNMQVEGDGTRLIRVMDNGVGMDQDDVLLCLERHATSKLSEEGQLAAITTLGFRGEALPSIGSVSRMSLLSRLHTADIGTRAEVRYGTLHDLHEDGCACGTIIEVRNLFGNLPARKKFLKSKRTELFHIEEVIRNQALAHPDCAFSLEVDGRKTIAFAAAEQEQRVRDVFRYSGRMLDIASTEQQNALALNGFLLLPDTLSTARLRILVNNRPVQDRMIRYAVAEGLKGLLMKGQQPAGALLLGLDPQQVDINVHPAKREIRFRRPNEVRRFLVRTVSEAVLRYQEARRSELFSPATTVSSASTFVQPDEQGQGPSFSSFSSESQGQGGEKGQGRPLSSSSQGRQAEQQTYRAEPLSFLSVADGGGKERERYGRGGEREEQDALISKQSGQQSDQAGDPQINLQAEQSLGYSGLRLIGQFLNLYLLCEHDEQLVVIDQHAAHERILYQQLRTAYEQRAVAVQHLLFPVTVELGPDHAEILEQEAEAVASLGLRVAFFGDTTWVVKGVPAMVGKVAPQEVLFDILDGLADRSGSSRLETVPECVDKLLASMACKAAIKSGNPLQPEEMLALLRQMEGSAFFSHCPHGRPVLKTFSRADVEKWFRRS